MSKGLETSFLKARTAERAGDLVAARQIYAAILRTFPGNTRALTALARLDGETPPPAKSGGDPLAALALLYRRGQFDLLVAQGMPLLARQPDSRPLLDLLGGAHVAAKRFAEAEALFRRSAAIDPIRPETFFNLGIALRALGRMAEALDAWDRAVALRPDHGAAHLARARLLRDLKREEEAIAAFRQVLALDAGHMEALTSLGAAFQARGDLPAASDAYRRAVTLRPDHAGLRLALGTTLRDQGLTDEAIDHYRQAAAIDPGNALAHGHLADLYRDRRQLDLAVASFAAVLAAAPGDDGARAQKLHLEAQMCDWSGIAAFRAIAGRVGTGTAPVSPFALLASEDDPAHQLRRSERWAAHAFPDPVPPLPARPKGDDAPIRIGYFSADFHDHATLFLMAGLLREHDRTRFEIHAYSHGSRKSGELRRQAAADVSHFHDVEASSDEELVALARSHHLDIAVDLKGYTTDSRPQLFAQRLAPVQINYLGYPGSMGADFIDYLVADPIVIPAAERPHYRERLLVLPHSYQPTDDRRPIAPRPASRVAVGLPPEGVVLCCFNNSYKIGPTEFDIWMRLLGQVEGGVLWLMRTNPWAAANLRREAEARGIDPGRLIFAPQLPQAEHLARLSHADLFLDTFHYNAHTTGSDALWAGVPLVTMAGRQFAARVAASLLHAVGLPELVTDTVGDYEALILDLARRPDRLAAIRAKLAANRSSAPLFDSALYARHLEAAYEAAWRRRQRGEPAEDIRIA